MTNGYPLPDVLTIRQAASYLGVHPETLRRWDAQGKLPALRVGPRGVRRYTREDVLRLAQSQNERVRDAQRVVVEVARAISGSLDLHAVARTVVDAAVHIVGSDRCGIYILNEERTHVEPLFGIDVNDPEMTERLFYPNPIPIDAMPLLTHALAHPEPLVIDDTETHPLSNPELFRFFNTRTVINIGLRGHDGQVFGMMPFIWTNQPHPVREDEVFFGQSLAALAEVALSNARLFAAVQQERVRATIVSDVVRGLNTGLNLGDTLTRAMHSLVAQLHADDGSIFLTDESGMRLIGAAETRLPTPTRVGAALSITESPNIALAIESGQPLLVSLAKAAGEEHDWYESLGMQAALFVPLVSQGRLVGMAFANFLDRIPRFNPDDLRFAGLLAGQCALAIERAQLVEATHVRAAELEAIFETMTEGISMSAPDGRTLRSNQANAELLEPTMGVPDLETRIRRYNLREADGTPLRWETSPTGRALRGEIVTNVEILGTRPDGTELSVLVSSAPVYDSSGNIRAAITTTRDITDIVAERREKATLVDLFRQKAAQLEAVISHMGEGLIIADQNGEITLINPYAARLHGTEKIHIAPEDYSNAYQLFCLDGTPYPPLELPLSRAALHGETVSQAEWRIRRPDGSEVIASGSATPIVGPSGERLGAVLVMRDITVKRQIEAEKDQFLSIVSHELKTPLTTIKGLNDLAQRRLARGVEPTKIQENLTGVAGQIVRMEALIEDLLDISRLETGVLPLARAQVDLVVLAREALIRGQAGTERHTLKFVDHDLALVLVDADQRRIEQVLDNILSNAIKYSPNGGTITLDLMRSEDRALLRVSDQGIGIPETGREHLFERFYRGANVVASEYGGLGIGLALSREIVHRHGGELTLEASSSRGSTFLLSLPLSDQTHSGSPGDS